MAKKSKKGRRAAADARGYSTSNSTSSSAAPRNKVAVSATAHEGLTSLLTDLKGGKEAASVPSVTSVRPGETGTRTCIVHGNYLTDVERTGHTPQDFPIDPADSKFIRRVAGIHSKLLALTFAEAQVESALTALGAARGSDFDLESALDWLCLNLSSEELPSLFIEQDVQISALEDGGISVHYVVNKSGGAANAANVNVNGNDMDNGRADSAHDLMDMMASASVSPRKRSSKNGSVDDGPASSSTGFDGNEEEKAKQKALLLAQYQYEADEGDKEQEEMKLKADEKAGRDAGEAKPQIEQAEETSPEERRLAELEKQIQEDSAILNDDAALYMMSKYEIVGLKKKVKKTQGQAKGLRGKVAKIRAERERRLREEDGAVGDEHEEEGAAPFSVFDNDDSDAEEAGSGITESSATPADEEKATEPAPLQHLGRSYGTIGVVSSSIPKDWHGKTPKSILEDYCRKQKMPVPKFSRLPQSSSACKLVLQRKKGDNQPFVVEHPGPFFSFGDAQHYLSTEALYELTPSLPLYRLMPTIFRTIWMTWQNEEKAKQIAEVSKEQDRKDADIQALVNAIYVAYKKTCGNVSTSQAKQSYGEEREVDSPVLDDWDDQSSVEESSEIGVGLKLRNYKPTSLGSKLSREFGDKTLTPAYKAMLEERKGLPIWSYRESILETVQKNPVTVLCASTGAGKSTNAPLFLLEDALESGVGDKVNIICTQPRRVAAISVAERVSDQMNEKIGGSVGYHIRMESKRSKRTKLLFCTTGVILRRLQDDPDLKGVTHVCLDEVHERQWQIDFLLIALRRLISTRKDPLKVVLMSATIDSKVFCNFYGGAPFLDIPGRTFPVASYYLEDLLEATDHIIEEGSRCALRTDRMKSETAQLWVTGRGGEKHKKVVSLEDENHHKVISEEFCDYSMTTRRSMDRVDEKVLNYELIEDVLTLLLLDPQRNGSIVLPEGSNMESIGKGAVLIFLPGMGEIRALTETLRASRRFGSRSRFDIIQMHSSLSPKDQRRAFLRPQPGCQKIILSTNICESSITINDVVCVIDTGLMREVRLEKRTGTSTLVTDWCSRANAKQRSGRAGRVQTGLCCKLFSSRTERKEMHEQPMPELQRVPLEEACLTILAGNLEVNCMDFLMQAPQPPSEESVKAALTLLEEVGAIEEFSAFKWAERTNQRLTPLGVHLAKLPVHVRLGKILIMGVLLNCLDETLTIAASLSTKSPFSTNVNNASEAAAAHRAFAHPSSDFISICNVWKAYKAASQAGYNSARKFCNKNFLNNTALLEIGDMRDQFLQLLRQIGFVSSSSPNALSEYSSNSKVGGVIDAVVVAGLYPNIAHAEKTSRTDPPSMWYRNERVHFHRSSINHKVVNLDSAYCAFYEKFAFGNRTYIAATSLAKPFSLMLFGKSLTVRHLERKVLVDDCITVNVAAQTGVAFRELRYEIERLLHEMILNAGNSRARSSNQKRMVEGIVELLANER